MYLVDEDSIRLEFSIYIYTVLVARGRGGKLVFCSEQKNQRMNLSQLFTQIKAFVCSLNHLIFQKRFDQMYLSLLYSSAQ